MTSLSGITPSGRLTIGNYLGALRRFADDPDGFYFVSDLHAMTTTHDPRRLTELTMETAGLMLASGLAEGTVFVQSTVPAHAQMAYLVECTSYVGEMGRMIQFKDKGRGRPMTRTSLFTYPCLMAADILLYDATHVPVGDDQDQHVELARDVAVRFNRQYGDTLVVPELSRAPAAAKINDLTHPTGKMSKSAPDHAMGVVRMVDDADTIVKKFRRAQTDSDADVRYEPNGKPGVSNLLEILAACTGRQPAHLCGDYTRYGDLKAAAAEAVVETLRPIQQRLLALRSDPAAVSALLERGRNRAAATSGSTLRRAAAAMGLLHLD
jgi:tryptophanyl-tRNA synthetase